MSGRFLKKIPVLVGTIVPGGVANTGATLVPGRKYELQLARNGGFAIAQVLLPHSASNGVWWNGEGHGAFRFVAADNQTTLGFGATGLTVRFTLLEVA